MLLECCFNKLTDIFDSRLLEHVKENVHLDEVNLEIGKKYLVYGVIFRGGIPWYYICEEENDLYPIPHFGGFFKVIDANLSKYWKLKWHDQFQFASLLPLEWYRDNLFYERLVNEDFSAQQAFQKIKKSFELESSIS